MSRFIWSSIRKFTKILAELQNFLENPHLLHFWLMQKQWVTALESWFSVRFTATPNGKSSSDRHPAFLNCYSRIYGYMAIMKCWRLICLCNSNAFIEDIQLQSQRHEWKKYNSSFTIDIVYLQKYSFDCVDIKGNDANWVAKMNRHIPVRVTLFSIFSDLPKTKKQALNKWIIQSKGKGIKRGPFIHLWVPILWNFIRF